MSTDTLWASLVWGAIGSGFALYGKKQDKTVPLAGGLVMIGLTYFCETALVMSLLGIALAAGIWWLTKRGVGEE
ncbi:MAG: amino acid transport protein [Verrucomicrobia bacterium]|nr:amino acid transport protein [Verrucomicrobiota bacterium]